MGGHGVLHTMPQSNFKVLQKYEKGVCRTKKTCKNFFINEYFRTFAIKIINLNSNKQMEIEGKIIAVLPAREGVSSRGTNWKSQDYVIETHEQYPRKCCFNVFGDRIAQFNIQIGQELRVSFDIDAHEYQGRWFNSLRAWKVEPIDPNNHQAAPQPAAYGAQAPIPPATGAAPAAPQQAAQAPTGEAAPFPPAQEGGNGSTDDLPF